MDVLVRQGPFKEENRGGFENDVDSDEEKLDKSDWIRTEFFGGMGKSECEEEEDLEGDLHVRRQAYTKFGLDECKAMLKRDHEAKCANNPPYMALCRCWRQYKFPAWSNHCICVWGERTERLAADPRRQ